MKKLRHENFMPRFFHAWNFLYGSSGARNCSNNVLLRSLVDDAFVTKFSVRLVRKDIRISSRSKLPLHNKKYMVLE